MNLLHKFWHDERGFVISVELMLVAGVLVFGIVVGLEQLRDATNAELNDLANAIRSINQSFSISPVQGPNGSYVAGSSFTDSHSGGGGQIAAPQSSHMQGIDMTPMFSNFQNSVNQTGSQLGGVSLSPNGTGT